jgi:3-dehydrosphinganine reductase
VTQAAAKRPSSQRFTYFSADVANADFAGPLLASCISWNNGQTPDIVWCCAGCSRPTLFVDDDPAHIRRQMEVNYYGSAMLAHAVLREWLAPSMPVEKDARRLIFTSSAVAFYTVSGYGSYGASKIALRSLADCLAQEVMLYPQNVEVHCVFPGNIDSPGSLRENETKPEITKILEEDDPLQQPDQVAEQCIRGLEKGHHQVTTNWLVNLMRWGVVGGSHKNNFVVDVVMGLVLVLAWVIAQPILLAKVRKFARENGHPSSYGTKGV